MANTFSALVPILYGDEQIVARELTAAVSAVDTKFDSQAAGLNQTIRVPIAPTLATTTYTPAMTTSAGADMVESYADVVLNNNYQSTFNLTGEQMAFLQTGGGGALFSSWLKQAFQQAIRSVVNTIEADLCTAIYKGASRATGTAGTTPFGSNLTDAANQRKVLDDNGAPSADRTLVISTACGANLRGLTQLTNVNQGGTSDVLRNGKLINLFGIDIAESAQTVTTTPGNGTSYVIDGTGNTAVGSTVLKLKTGSGTIVAGDVISIQSDSNKYVVTSALSGGLVTIGAPGLKVATADSKTVTVGSAYSANFALHKNSVVAVIRPPFIPQNPGIRTYPIMDPKTGLTLLVAEVIGDGMITYRVHAVTGYKVVQGANISVLMG